MNRIWRILGTFLGILAVGTLAATQSSTQGGGFSTKAIQALENCFDEFDNFTCSASTIMTSDNTWTGLNVFNRTAAGVDVCFGGAEGDANSICIDGDTGQIIYEGAAADAFETFLMVTDPTADRTITFPNATGTLPLLTTTNSWTGMNTFSGTIDVDGVAGAVSPGQSGTLSIIIFEGSTADAIETALVVNDERFEIYANFDAPTEGQFAFFDAPDASTSGSLVQFISVLNAMNGSDTVNFLNLDPTNANHTGAGNTLNGILVDSITGDADATENAINIGTGWDTGVRYSSGTAISGLTNSLTMAFGATLDKTMVFQADGGSSQLLFNDDVEIQSTASISFIIPDNNFMFAFDASFGTIFEIADDPTSGALFRLRGDFNQGGATGGNNVKSLLIDPQAPASGLSGTGSYDGIEVDVGSGADHTGGSIRGIYITDISPDVDTQEDALRIDGGWDRGLVFGGDVTTDIANTTGELNINSSTIVLDLGTLDYPALAAPAANPAANRARIYVDESTDRVGAAAADCVLVSRLSTGAEVNIAVLVVDGGCP